MATKFLCFLGIVVGFNLPCYADGPMGTAGSYMSYKEKEVGHEFTLLSDLRLGYRWDLGKDWRLAGLAVLERDQTTGTSLYQTRNSLGVSAGLYWTRFYFLAAWMVRSWLDGGRRPVGITGSGLRFDGGINFQLFEIFWVGPRLTFRAFWYDGDSIGSGRYTSIEPTFSVSLFL